MTHDELRNAIELRIVALVKARRTSTDTEKRKAFSEAIDLLGLEVGKINMLAADELGTKVDDIIRRLKQIQEGRPLDAGSALARTIKRLQDLVANPAAGGN